MNLIIMWWKQTSVLMQGKSVKQENLWFGLEIFGLELRCTIYHFWRMRQNWKINKWTSYIMCYTRNFYVWSIRFCLYILRYPKLFPCYFFVTIFFFFFFLIKIISLQLIPNSRRTEACKSPVNLYKKKEQKQNIYKWKQEIIKNK